MDRIATRAILLAILVVTAGLSWSRSSSKWAITASTVIAIVGLIRLLHAIHVFRGESRPRDLRPRPPR